LKLAFAYIRRSSYKQQENNSVEIQKQHIQEFAKRTHLFVPKELIFIEDVTSAFSKRAIQRKQLMNLQKQMIEMNIPTVIFHDISRMDRTGYSFTIDFYRPMLEKLPDLEVYTTESDKPINPNDPSIQMNFLLFQHESEVKSVRAVHNLKNDLESDEHIRPGSKTPYGYTQINKQLKPNEDAEIVAFIFYLSSWGKSLRKIADFLNNADIPSPKGGTWRSSSVENILKNTVYTGNLIWDLPKREDGGQKHYRFENSHPAITNQALLHFIKLNNHLLRRFGRIDTPFLFLNKVKCCHCNQFLSTQNGSTKRNGVKYYYHYYVCKSCDYKINTQEVHHRLIPEVLMRVKELISSNQVVPKTLADIKEKIRDVDQCIETEISLLGKFEERLKVAIELKDRELQLKILELIQHHKDSLSKYTICKDDLITIYQLVKTDQFFPRFNDILDYQLGTDEKRLVILYFVDYVFFSIDQEPIIQYKINIF